MHKLKGKMIEQSGGRDGGYGGRNQRNTAARVSAPSMKSGGLGASFCEFGEGKWGGRGGD